MLVTVMEVWTFSTLYWTLGLILLIQGLLVATGVAAMGVQIYRERRDEKLVGRVDRRIDGLLERLADQGMEAIDESDRPIRPRERQLTGRRLFERLDSSRGPEYRRLSRLYDRLGYLERDRRQCRSRRWQRRLEAMRRLFGIDWDCDRQLLVEGLEDHPRIRLLCARMLVVEGRLADAVRGLNALEVSSNLMEQTVYGVLGEVDDARLRALVDNLERLDNPRSRRAIVVRAASRGLSGLEPALESLAASEDFQDRLSVCLAADQLAVDRAVELLERALKDPCWEVRAYAAKLLAVDSGSRQRALLKSALGESDFWGTDRYAVLTPEVSASVQGGTLTVEEHFELSADKLQFFEDYLDTAVDWVPRLEGGSSPDSTRRSPQRAEIVA